jgi:hypothetical protein
MTPTDKPNRWELRIGRSLVADSAEPKPAPWVPVYAARRLEDDEILDMGQNAGMGCEAAGGAMVFICSGEELLRLCRAVADHERQRIIDTLTPHPGVLSLLPEHYGRAAVNMILQMDGGSDEL